MNYSFQSTVIISDVKLSFPDPLLYAAADGAYGAIGMSSPRSVTAVDMNGDGWLDIFMQPSYFSYAPTISPVILLNDKKGGFYDGSATVFKTQPALQQANNVFFEDFNKDRRVDLFVIDQGLELRGKDGGSWDGASNRLFLQGSDGVLQDVSASLTNNKANFNHVSSIGDINGDGNADIVVTALGGSTFEGQGTSFYLGNGEGGFTYSVAGLPEEIKYLAVTARKWDSKTIDYQFSGSNGIGDLNNDGLADLVTASYISNDLVSGQRTLRTFEQQPNGEFVQKWSINQPAALVTIFGVMGVAGIQVGDLDGDGRNDIVALWENGSKTAVQVLRNLGGGQFSDTTVDWLGSYLPREFKEEGTGYYQNTVTALELRDVNHDGNIDLILKQHGIAPAQLDNGTATGAFLYLNDGAGHLSAVNPTVGTQELTAQQLGSVTGNPEYGLGVPLMFDANNDGMEDMVFIEPFHNMNQTVFPYKVTTLHVSVVPGAETQHIYRAGDLGDALVGSAGADTFHGGRGSDTFTGGEGIDTAVYAGVLAGYKLAAASGSFVVRGAAGGASADSLSGVERISFADASVALYNGSAASFEVTKNASGMVTVRGTAAAGTVAETLQGVDRILFNDAAVRFDIDGAGGQAYRVYQAAFDRTPDLAGLGYWIAMIDQGVTLASVAGGFAASPEFKQLYGAAPTNREIIEKFYLNVLDRPGESAGVDFWAGVLDAQQATVAEVLMGFSESAENKVALIGVTGNGITYVPFG